MSAHVQIAPEEIDGGFVPEARPDVASVAVGREVVLARIADGASHLDTCALNESGSIVWQCFDGSGTIDEIAADVADVFGADVDTVRADIEELARQVGSAGFLVGVQEQVIDVGGGPAGIAVGAALPHFEAEDLEGAPVSPDRYRGRRTLLVSWSPTCRFCELIAADLADLEPALAAAGVDLVRVLAGDADVFTGLGTPVAYFVDENGNLAAPLALGAPDVLQLAQRIASTGSF